MFTNCVYVKNLGASSGAQKAVMMMNRASHPVLQTVYWSDLGFASNTMALVSNVWTGTVAGNFAGSFQSITAGNDAGLFIISAGQNLYGNGADLTNINGANITAGTIPDVVLSANVELLNAVQTNTGAKTFSGGLSASKIVANGFASTAANPTLAIAGTGVTNTLGVNADAYVTCIAATFTIFNNAGTAVLTNFAATCNNQMFHLQPGGSIQAAGGLSGTLVPW